MFIQSASAQESPTANTVATMTAAPKVPAAAANPPSGTEMVLWNVGFVVLMIVMFYLLLIRPQQSRYRAHADMLKAMKKGDKVVLQSGMIATIDHINDNEEMTVELAPGHKVHIFRSAIAGKYEDYTKKR